MPTPAPVPDPDHNPWDWGDTDEPVPEPDGLTDSWDIDEPSLDSRPAVSLAEAKLRLEEILDDAIRKELSLLAAQYKDVRASITGRIKYHVIIDLNTGRIVEVEFITKESHLYVDRGREFSKKETGKILERLAHVMKRATYRQPVPNWEGMPEDQDTYTFENMGFRAQ